MATTLYELANKKAPEVSEEDKAKIEETKKGELYLKDLLKGEIPVEQAPTFEEAIMTHDYLTLFKKVVEDMTLKPKEPVMIGQDLIATTVSMPGTYTEVRIPAFGSLKAHEIGQAQELSLDSSLVA